MPDPNSTRLDSLDKVVDWFKELGYLTGVITEENWWIRRELLRMDVSTPPRVAPPWVQELPNYYDQNHFVYVAHSDPMRIAYTPNEADGRRDRQVLTTPGRYLTKHWGHVFDEKRIAALASFHRSYFGEGDVRFALDAEDIQRVYKTGPRSCMVDDFSCYVNEHPTRAYDGPDFAVAYLEVESRIVARAILYMGDEGRLTYGRQYGDGVLLAARLEKLGINNGTPTHGLRLRREPIDDTHFLCPYLDHAYGVHDTGEYLAVCSEDHDDVLECQRTDGQCGRAQNDDTVCCSSCDDYYDAGDMNDSNNGLICDYCRDEHFVYAITSRHDDQTYVHQDDVIEIKGTYYINSSSTLRACGMVYCDSEGEWMSADDAVSDIHGNWIPSDEAVELATGGWLLQEDAAECDGEYFDPNNLPATHRETADGCGVERVREGPVISRATENLIIEDLFA